MEIWVEKGGLQVSGENKKTEKFSAIFIFIKNIIIFSGCYLKSDAQESDLKPLKWTCTSINIMKQFDSQFISLTEEDKTIP